MTIPSVGLARGLCPDCYRSGTRSAAGWLLLAGIAWLVLVTLLAGCGEDETTGPTIRRPEDFLPPGTEGMPKDGSPSTATDAAGLQFIINGGFQKYTDNGFREMVEQVYAGTVAGTAAVITVRIFDMGTAENAQALHEEILDEESSWEELNEIGDQDHEWPTSSTYSILFRRNEYSAELVITNPSQDAKDLLLLFATHIDTEINR